jgi:UDP-N-acetylmuramate--alanine ligase
MVKSELQNTDSFFFIGIAGSGMSAIAQYLASIGKDIAGSDRLFISGKKSEIQIQLEAENIKCFPQDGSGLSKEYQAVVVSTAVEKQNIEYRKAIELNIRVHHRSDVLAAIAQTKKTIAIAGTSGKSTVTAMTFEIFEKQGLKPSLISGAGLKKLQERGKIGNAVAGKGEYLIIEADESDGTLVKYKAFIGIILNIDKDHKELNEPQIDFIRIFIVNIFNHFNCV